MERSPFGRDVEIEIGEEGKARAKFPRKRAIAQQRRREGACNRVAAASGAFCGKGGMTQRYEKSPAFRRGDARKQRRKKAAFARLRRQILSTTTKGAFEKFPCTRIKIDLFMVSCSSAPEFWMEKVRRAAPQALVAWGAALSALYAKILRQNRRFLASPRLISPFL